MFNMLVPIINSEGSDSVEFYWPLVPGPVFFENWNVQIAHQMCINVLNMHSAFAAPTVPFVGVILNFLTLGKQEPNEHFSNYITSHLLLIFGYCL